MQVKPGLKPLRYLAISAYSIASRLKTCPKETVLLLWGAYDRNDEEDQVAIARLEDTTR